MSSPFFQPLDPAGAPDPVTHADSPGDAAGWAEVTPHGTVPAPYDINAPQDIAGISGAVQAAMGLSGGQEGASTGAGIPNMASPRQAEAQALLDSPQGQGAMNVLGGFPDYEDNNVSPGANLETPIQGHGFHPGTTQDDVPMFDDGFGNLDGVPPEGGSMGPPVAGYPGTTQDGLQKYGTS